MRKNKKYIYYALFSLIFFVSCDPIGKICEIHNNSQDTIVCVPLFIKDSLYFKPSEPIIVMPGKEGISGSLFMDAKGAFDYANTLMGDPSMEVLIFKITSMKDTAIIHLKRLHPFISQGKYWIHTFYYEELEKKDFKVFYPEDGFKKGKPINLYNAYEIME